jgi:hypothetical protein
MMEAMSTIGAEAFFSALLGDEGWQAPLSEASISHIIASLEARIPPYAELPQERVSHFRETLRDLVRRVETGRLGPLDESAAVNGWLNQLEF